MSVTTVVNAESGVGPRRDSAREASPVRARWAVPASLAAGGGLLLAFPPYGLWWLAPVAVGALAVAVHRRGPWSAAGLGLLTGLAFFVPLLSWTNIVAGWAPWLILATFEAGYLALLAAVAALTSPLIDRYRWLWPVVTGALWVGQEALRDRVPFGGFPWGRLAFSQGDAPTLHYAALGGAPLVTFVVALCGGLLALAGWRRWTPPWLAGWRRPATTHPASARQVGLPMAAVGAVLAGVLVAVGGLLVPTSTPHGKAITVAIIQGNVPRMGLEFNAQRRAVLDNHVNATLELARQVAAGRRPAPDLVIWPENASDIDPLVPDNQDARDLIDRAANEINAPILVGAVLRGPGTNSRNAAIVWRPGTGPASPVYIKQHPVPFAEYMPLRSIARLVTSKVDLVRSDFVPGHRPGVLDTGPATIGDVICFEVGYDDLVRSTVTGGAQLLTVQTNNADFNNAEANQQLAMVRLRAVEHGRDALMASTVGVSGFVTADGRVFDATRLDTRAVLVRQLHLGTERTLASEIGPTPEFVLAGLGVVALLGAILIRRRREPSQEEA